MSSSSRLSKPANKSAVKLIVIAALSLFIVVSAVPRYVTSWPWATPLKVPNQSALQAIRDEGISLAGWRIDDQVQSKIGGDTWSIQQLSAESANSKTADSILLLLRPQVWEADQPEVEWLNLKGSQRWQTDSTQKIAFELPVETPETAKSIRINTQFFRAWSKDQTYAVMQWYAWPTGGNSSPAWWFWADQKKQWQQRERLPWVAVSLWLPIEPLGDIAPYLPEAEALGKAVHARLLATVFDRTS